MVFVKWLGIILLIIIILIFVIKFLTRNKYSDYNDEFDGRLSGLEKLWDECCRKNKNGVGI